MNYIPLTYLNLAQSYPTDDKGLPLQEGKGDISSILPGVSPGEYYIIVKTNIRQTIRENKTDNNSAYSENPFAVSVPEITLNSTSTLQDSIFNEGINYYQVEVDSLGDESLQIVLDGLILDKGTTTFNEMYVKYGEMPTLSNYEYAYDKINSADQTIMIPNTQIGTYYIMVKNNHQDVEPQNISLHARLVGFELISIDQFEGGNSGEITIKMNGAAFSYGVKPVLEQNEVNFIYAKETYYTDNTELYATFDLKGKNSGAWDVKLIKDLSRYDWIYKELHIDTLDVDTVIMVPDSMYLVYDSLVAELTGAFYITTSDNKGYLENIDKPETARGGRKFSASVEIINLSNNDMVAPLYMLKSNSFMTKLPGEYEYTLGYKKFLMLSKDGPAGVLRPGERTTISILAEAPMITGNMVFRIVKIQDSGFEFNFENEIFWTGADRENPDWTEVIYQLEQEIGNSWEGYNRVLSKRANNINQKIVIPKSLLSNLINHIWKKQNCDYMSTKKVSLNLKEDKEISYKYFRTKCKKSEYDDKDVDCMPFMIERYQILLGQAIVFADLFGQETFSSFLRVYVGRLDSTDIKTDFGPDDREGRLALSEEINYSNSPSELAVTIQDIAKKDIEAEIYERTPSKDTEFLPFKIDALKDYFVLADDNVGGVDFHSDSGNFTVEAEMMHSFARMKNKDTQLIVSFVGMKPISTINYICMKPDTDTESYLLTYNIEYDFRFEDKFDFDPNHVSWRNPWASAGYFLLACGYAHPFNVSLKVNLEKQLNTMVITFPANKED